MNKNFFQQIKQMYEIDQSARSHHELQPKDGSLGLINYIVYLIDAVHNYKIYGFVKKYGFPTVKLIGKQGMKYFHLLIQHQDLDPDLQKECLKKCDFSEKNKAFLTDRILVNSGQKQKYGTQFFYNKKKKSIVLHPIINKKTAELFRKKIGLPKIEEDLLSLNKKIKFN